MTAETTLDGFLDHRLRLYQPREGYRAAIDPVFLAAAVPAGPGDTILDVGAGVGTAALCLAARVADCVIDGLELQAGLVALARQNVELNGMTKRVRFHQGDLLTPPVHLARLGFDHVMANPPFHSAQAGSPSPRAAKSLATRELGADLHQWLESCLAMTKPSGRLTVIHRAERLDDIRCAVERVLGSTSWRMRSRILRARVDGPARRVLVAVEKGRPHGVEVLPAFVLHEAGGAYTPQAEAVLRGAGAIAL